MLIAKSWVSTFFNVVLKVKLNIRLSGEKKIISVVLMGEVGTGIDRKEHQETSGDDRNILYLIVVVSRLIRVLFKWIWFICF